MTKLKEFASNRASLWNSIQWALVVLQLALCFSYGVYDHDWMKAFGYMGWVLVLGYFASGGSNRGKQVGV